MQTADTQLRAELTPLVEAMKAQKFDVAISGLKGFLQKYPEHEIASGLLASAYFQLGMIDKAQSVYQGLLDKHPGNALARFQLGMVHFSKKRYEDALDTWAPLLEIDTDFMGHFHSALAHLQLGRQEVAKPLLERAAMVMPSEHPLFAQLQQLRAHLGSSSAHPYGHRHE